MLSYRNVDYSYVFDFNGKETDSETDLQDYGLRIYNKSYGKFLSVDPLHRDYPWNSSYAFAENRVIDGIDLEGGEYQKAPGMFRAHKTYIKSRDNKPVGFVPRTNYTLIMELIPEYYKKAGAKTQDEVEKLAKSTKLTLQNAKRVGPGGKSNAGLAAAKLKKSDLMFGLEKEQSFNEKTQIGAMQKFSSELNNYNSAYVLTQAAWNNDLFPASLKYDNEFIADVINFVYSGVLPGDESTKLGSSRNAVIKSLGGEIYDNRGLVLLGKYDRPKTPIIIYPRWDLDKLNLLSPIVLPDMSQSELDRLTEQYNAEKQKSKDKPSSIKKGN
jgi:RHS repeat-associated protein